MKATVRDVVCLKAVIEPYCSIFGQAINVAKSHIMISPIVPSPIKAAIKRIMLVNENTRL